MANNPRIYRGRYREEGFLDGGGFGSILKATDMNTPDELPVAIKRIAETVGTRSPSFRQQIESEVRILQENSARFPFIPNFYEYWSEQIDEHTIHHYIVMEYIDGDTLELSENVTWTEKRVLDFLRTLLNHLKQLHDVGIVHRDIKPLNIKKADRGFVILDFGISTQNTATLLHGLSPDYAAPEQFQKIKRLQPGVRIGRQADLYSLAATAFFLLTHEPPTRADLRLGGVELKLPTQFNQASSALRETLLDMLELDTSQRPPDAGAVLERLHHRLSGKSVEKGQPPSPPSDVPEEIPAEPPPAPAGITAVTPEPREAAAVAPISTLGKGRITDIAWAPSGQELVIATAVGVYRYGLGSGGDPQLFRSTPAPVQHTGFVAKGTTLALALDNLVQLWSITDQKLINADQPIVGYPTGSPGKLLADASGELLIVATDAGMNLWQIGAELRPIGELTDEINVGCLALSQDGSVLTTVSDGQVKWWRLLDGSITPLPGIRDVPSPVVSVALGHDGQTLALASTTTVYIWSSAAQQLIVVAQHEEPITRVALDARGRYLAVATDTAIHMRYLHAQGASRSLPGRPSGVAGLAFSPDGRYLAAAAPERVWIWRVEGDQEPVTLDFSGGVEHLALTSDGQSLITAGRALQSWRVEGGTIEADATMERLPDQPRGIALHVPPPNARSKAITVAVATDRQIIVGELRTKRQPAEAASLGSARATVLGAGGAKWKQLLSLDSAAAQEHSLVFSKDGQRLLNITAESVEVWHVRTGQLTHRFERGMARVCDVALAPDKDIVATCSDRAVQIWRLDHRGEIRTVTPELSISDGINTIALSADGRLLAVGANDMIQVLHVSDGMPVDTIFGAGKGAQRLVFAPDGGTLAAITGAEMRLLRLEPNGLRELDIVRGHTERITDVSFAGDWHSFATASYDGTVRLWFYREQAQ